MTGLNPSRTVLDNGLVVLGKQTTVTPAVTIHVATHAGIAADAPDRPGIAHFVSRMLDRGTRTMTAEAIAEALDGRGAALAIALNRHATSLVCTCLVEDFEAVLAIMADCLTSPAFPEEQVAIRRGEILTLIRQDEDNPASVAIEALMQELYGPTHPYGRRPRGGVEVVEQIDREALVDFHRRLFRPDSTVVAIVGDVEPVAGAAAVERALGHWRTTVVERVPLPMPAPAVTRRTRVIPMMNKSQADIAYGFTSILRADPRYYAYALMNNVLGQYSLGGRLGDSIREKQGMAYYVNSALDANVIPGPLFIRAGVNAANVDRAVASIDEELQKMVEAGPTDKEVAESRQYLIGSQPRHLETNLGIANFLQTTEFFGLGLDYDVRMPDLLRAVTRDDVHTAAREALQPSRATVVVAGPYEGAMERPGLLS